MKHIIYILYKNIQTYFAYLINSLFYLSIKNPLPVKAWVNITHGKLVSNNWGDDLNMFLLPLIAKRDVIVVNRSLFHILKKASNYLCIGSILGDYEDEKSEIWGAGVMSDEDEIKARPKAIYSVRGKLSRKKLVDAGIDCPEIYGDPALLLSHYYIPQINKKYKMGIIPNHIDNSNKNIKSFLECHPDCMLINMSGYNLWTDIIDNICSCEYIVSSSLHGLIVADSYKIPNTWVFFSDNILGGEFKYLDYFSSVDRNETSPIRIRSKEDIGFLYNNHPKENKCTIDFQKIIESCPFRYNVEK